jgi:hypothetical protein
MERMSTEEGAATSPCATASKNVDAGNRSNVNSPVRHLHRDVAELLLAAGTSPRRRPRRKPTPAPAAADVRGRARYGCAFEEEAPEKEGGFAPPRLVWAKVLGHPWWPGQVFAPSDASAPEAARRRPGRVLRGPDLRVGGRGGPPPVPRRLPAPRRHRRPEHSKSTFVPALDDALDEVSRRVDAGLSCTCCAANVEQQVVQNSGVRTGARGAAVDAAFARESFRGEAFVRYVRALAVAPEDGADRLDLAVAAAQMKAFTRWRRPADPEHHDSSAGVDDVANGGAIVVAALAGRGRPRRGGTRRGLFRGDAADGEMGTLLFCARARRRRTRRSCGPCSPARRPRSTPPRLP